MGTCVIFGAAEFDSLLQPIAAGDCVIAADGGVSHVQKLGIRPDVILGDFDSLGYVPQDSCVFPVEKDDTDAMLAVRRGLELGYEDFLIYGGLDGERLDHTVANFQLLEYLAQHGARGCLVGSRYLVTVVRNGSLTFPADCSGIVSVFCLGADARGVTIRGLKYGLEDGCLTAGFPLGVSNAFCGTVGEIRVDSGSLLVLWDRKNGLPRR